MNVLAVVILIISIILIIIMINCTIARIFLDLVSQLFSKQLTLVVEMRNSKNQNHISQNMSLFV